MVCSTCAGRVAAKYTGTIQRQGQIDARIVLAGDRVGKFGAFRLHKPLERTASDEFLVGVVRKYLSFSSRVVFPGA